MRFKHSLFIALLFLMTILSSGQVCAVDDKAFISNMTVSNANDSLRLYFDVENAFNYNIMTALESGLSISLAYPVTVYRTSSVVWDKKIIQTELVSTIKYDTLKKDYTITRYWKNASPHTVKSLDEAKALMTRIDGFTLGPSSELVKGETYRVRAKARLLKVAQPIYLKFVIFFMNNWKLDTNWESVEFIY